MTSHMNHETYATQYNGEDDLNVPVPRPDQYPEDPAASQSYWIRECPIELDELRQPLPDEVDVAIIGSGITGAAAAYRISEKHPELRIAIFEARGICTGATGRNGGHVARPECYQVRQTSEQWGPEETIRMRKLGLMNRSMMLNCIEELGGKEMVDLRLDGTIVVFETAEERDNYHKDAEFCLENGYKPEGIYLSPEETIKRLGFEFAKAEFGSAYLETSGTVYPRKFVNLMIKKVINRMSSFSVHPYTPVEGIECVSSSDFGSLVRTTRGNVRARAVFHATNAWAANLCPSLHGSKGVFGCKAHMLGVQPNIPGSGQLDMGFGYADFWHWIQQRPNHGPFLYGLAEAELLNEYDDTITLPEDHPARGKMIAFLESSFPQWFQHIGKTDIVYDWTGVQGFTMTGASIVGRPSTDRPGEFASVGHNGEGMGRCFACATVATDALLAHLQGDKYLAPTWFPHGFLRNM